MTDTPPLQQRIADAIQRQAQDGNVRYGALAAAVLAELKPELDLLAALREVARGYCPACGRGDAAPTVADWERERERAEFYEAALSRMRDREEVTGVRAKRAEAAITRIRALHSNHNGICGWCKGPDNPNTSWDMEYRPCATIRATLDDPDSPAPEFGGSNHTWHWRCNGGQGCDGWVGVDLHSEDAAHREYARHFEEEHLGQRAPAAATQATDTQEK